MEEFYRAFLDALGNEDKEKSVQLVAQLLQAGDVGVVQLYTQVLGPALNEWECREREDPTCIWREHVRSSIVRTIVEMVYPYVLRERDASGVGRRGVSVAVMCPPEELHEIGPRMVADFFTLAGYDVTFVGANTPIETMVEAIRTVRPRYVAFSVTNFYNLVALRRAVERIREAAPEGTQVIVGGSAFAREPSQARQVGADRVLATFEDIKALEGGD